MTTTSAEESATILLVEDDAELARVISVLLERDGHTVRVAGSGAQALQMLGLTESDGGERPPVPDLILLDVLLKGPGGYEVCQRLREDGRMKAVPVIMLTVLDSLEHTLKGLGAGANDYVTKPFKNPELLARVEAQLRVKRLQDERDRAEQALQRRTKELRALTARLAEAEEEHRRRIAQELHDQVGQNLTALGINLNIVRSQLENGENGPIAARLEDSLAIIEQTTERIRDLMADLRPPVLDDYGLVAAVRWYCEQFSSRTGIETTVEGDDPDPRLPTAIETALFRVAQEALTNVTKHSQATQVTVSVTDKGNLVRLVIADNGVGFDATDTPPRGGWGLLTMTERAEAAGGRCRIISGRGKGTQIIVEVER
ncbi:MAG: response regulator [Anaerolineales bacterium]|nr:MAG: response regulator [Anaerolineales bacterium]